jgi:hypothetical protein
VDRWRVVHFELEELQPLVGSALPFFGVVSSMLLMHPLGCILEKKLKVDCTVRESRLLRWTEWKRIP